MSLDPKYRVLFCDLWGCVHNGVAPFPGAVDTLLGWKAEGRTIVFLTNAPRPAHAVVEQLESLDIPADCYDGVVSSGDAALAYLAEREAAEQMVFVGPERDRKVLLEEGLTFGDSGDIVCCGFADDRPNDMAGVAPLLEAGAARGAEMACLNPDLFVIRGGKKELCAGAIAEEYAALGGKVTYFGKPYAPIYDRAMAVASQAAGRTVSKEEVAAIGDNAKTDLRGAIDYGLAFAFISTGVEAVEEGAEAGLARARHLFAGEADADKALLIAAVEDLAALS
ncbi:TIGR01459 family HAD-type hydrolase [Aurantiacibacter gilvus]|uniref:TIGR01459 family HAD-type hydrolase n=1 Tax=Aurantiacibacter gilvus TaxID=3139141 RepID=A0ABU9IGJ4_9SPHN